MTWSISVSGDRQSCVDKVASQRHPSDHGGHVDEDQANDVAQYEETRLSILDELEDYPTNAISISVSATGHSPPSKIGGSKFLNVSISGTVPAES